MESTHTHPHVEALGFLKGFRLGPQVSKERATHQIEIEGCEGRSFFEVSKEARRALRGHIIRCWTFKDPLPLSEIAPRTSRLFMDLDTNKKSDDEEILENDVLEFVTGFQRFLGYVVENGTLKIVEEGAAATDQSVGDAFIPKEGLRDENGGHVAIDGGIAYILSSDLGKVSGRTGRKLMSYHIVFPLLYGVRADIYNLLRAVSTKDDHSLATKFRRAIAGYDHVLRYLDLEVLRTGFLRAPFCDKLGAGRPYEPFAIVNKEKVFRRGSTDLIDDFVLAFNATSILNTPDEISALSATLRGERPRQQVRAQPPRRAANAEEGVPDAETLDPAAWRERFRISRKRYNPLDIRNLIERAYERFTEERENTKQVVLDRIKRAVVFEMNHHIAFLAGRQKASFVTKCWHRDEEFPEFQLRDASDVAQMFLPSATTILWPPEGRQLGANGEPRKPIEIKPFNVWLASPLRVEFSNIVVKPPGAIPQAEPEDLNLWAPIAISKAVAAGKFSHSISLPMGGKWSVYCREWKEEMERRTADGGTENGARCGGYIPPSAVDDKFARPVFAAGEIYAGEGGEIRRRFDIYTFTRHIHDMLCGGNDALFRFVMCWFASLVQSPGKKLRSCLIFVGEEGCGKNFVIDSLGAILGQSHYMATASHADLDRFNSALCGKTLLVLNECSRFTAAEEAALRTLVTEGKLRVEQKFKEALFLDNLVNVICITNITTHNLFSTVSANARRWCMARCRDSPTLAEDPLYWKGLWSWLGVADGQVGTFGRSAGICAFADLLYNYKIPDDWNSGTPPATEELVLHQLGGMNEVAHWWHECLISGRLYPAGAGDDRAVAEMGGVRDLRYTEKDFSAMWVKEPVEVDLELLYQESFIRSFHGKRASVVTSSTLPWFKKQLEELGAFYTTRPRDTRTRRRKTLLYQLKICRQHFCAKYKAEDTEAIFGDGIDADTGVRLDFSKSTSVRAPSRSESRCVDDVSWMNVLPTTTTGPVQPFPPMQQDSLAVDDEEHGESDAVVPSVLGPLLDEANEIERDIREAADRRRMALAAASGIPQDINPRAVKRKLPPPDVKRFIDDSAEEDSVTEEDEEEDEEGEGEPPAKHKKVEAAASAEAGEIWQKRQEEEQRRREEMRRVALEEFVKKGQRNDPFIDEAALAALAAAKAPASTTH